jgi:lipoate-protein ligase A
LQFKEFTDPVIKALAALGVEAELSGRNDILVKGRKISGNAQFTTAKSMFSHGTLLFDSQLENVAQALKVKMAKIESKGIKSVRSRVANIREFLAEEFTIEEFRARLIRSIFGGADPASRYELSDEQWKKIHQLADAKYRDWNWNFGKSPRFNLQRIHRFPIGEIDARINVREGRIEQIRIYGDFLGQGDIADLEGTLAGVRFDPEHLAEALTEIDVADYFGGLSTGDFLGLLHD